MVEADATTMKYPSRSFSFRYLTAIPFRPAVLVLAARTAPAIAPKTPDPKFTLPFRNLDAFASNATSSSVTGITARASFANTKVPVFPPKSRPSHFTRMAGRFASVLMYSHLCSRIPGPLLGGPHLIISTESMQLIGICFFWRCAVQEELPLRRVHFRRFSPCGSGCQVFSDCFPGNDRNLLFDAARFSARLEQTHQQLNHVSAEKPSQPISTPDACFLNPQSPRC